MIYSAWAKKNGSNIFTAGTHDFSAATALILPSAAGAAPTASGDVRYDTTGQRLVAGGGGGTQVGYIPRLIASPTCTPSSTDALDAGTVAGGTIQVFNTTVSLATGLWIVGKKFWVACNFDQTGSGTVPTMILGMRVQKSGPTNVNLYVSGAVAPSAATGTTRGFGHLWMLEVLSVGATGTVECVQTNSTHNPGTNALNQATIPATFDMTAAQTLQWHATWGAQTAGNIVRLRSVSVLEMN